MTMAQTVSRDLSSGYAAQPFLSANDDVMLTYLKDHVS